MAITWPAKNNYATGDVLTATNMNGIGDDLNALFDNSFYAGKNKIINGDFGVNQRNFSSTTTNNDYGFDRFKLVRGAGGTVTYSAQTFTPGTAPVAGYEGKNYARIVTASQSAASDRALLFQGIENVRTLAGQTATISFWAKAASGTPKMSIEFQQTFGSGGSSQVNTDAGQITLSTSWARYSKTITVPSVSGKTIGTGDFSVLALWVSGGSDWASRIGSIGNQDNTFDIWGVQVEAGSTATPFQTATGTIQNELAACQRYYIRYTGNSAYTLLSSYGTASTITNARAQFIFPVTMRVQPSALDYSALAAYDGSTVLAASSAAISFNHINQCSIDLTVTGATALGSYACLTNNNANGYVGFSAEL